MNDIDQFYSGVSWNQTFYGVPIQGGGHVWSNCLTDVLNYAGRVEGSKVEKSCWGKVREKMIEQRNG
jgi:hypothetical protein